MCYQNKESASGKIVDVVKIYKKLKGGGVESEFKRWHMKLKVAFISPIKIYFVHCDIWHLILIVLNS